MSSPYLSEPGFLQLVKALLHRATAFAGPNSNSLCHILYMFLATILYRDLNPVTSSYRFSGSTWFGGKKHNSRGEATNCSSCDQYTQALQMQIFQTTAVGSETRWGAYIHISLDFHLPSLLSVTHNIITSVIYCMKYRKIKSVFCLSKTLKVNHHASNILQ
jgi:hypothetical protein